MERATVMKTFHGNLTPKSPTLRDGDASFSSYLRPDHKPIITCQPHHHPIGSGRCRALDDSDYASELSIFDAHKYFNEVSTNNEIQKVSISCNSRVSPLANMDTTERIPDQRGDIITETTRYSSASSSVDGYASIRNYRARSFHAATPTASSQASWNSQAGLLSHPPGAIPVSIRNPPNPTDLNKKLRASLSKGIWLLRRKCPCSGKKSVEVKDKTPEPKTQIPPATAPTDHSLNLKRQDHDSNPKTMNMDTEPKNPKNIIPITPNNNNNNWVVDQTTTFLVTKSQRFHPHRVVRVPFTTDGFTFPVLNPHSSISSTSSSATTKLYFPNGVVSNEEEDPPRDSLEVFQPPDTTIEPTSVSPKSRVVEDDAASDASSDLFEIESFSTAATQSTYPIIYRRTSRDSFDEASNTNTTTTNTNTNTNANNGFFFGRRSVDEGSATLAMTECYEPSEASIEWSVTTAEGYHDRASVVADDEICGGGGGGGGAAVEKGKRKGLLVSCRCEKAVSVGPQPVKKCGAEGQRGTTSSSRHVNVIVSGNGGSGSGSGRAGAGFVNKPPLARPHHHSTARVSLALAT